MTDACSTCRFAGQMNSMVCRRYPPTVSLFVENRAFQHSSLGLSGWTENIKDMSFFPMVTPETWCGEYDESDTARDERITANKRAAELDYTRHANCPPNGCNFGPADQCALHVPF